MLHNTRTEDCLNVFCLVDGEPQSNVFSVKPTPSDTVDDLKVLISARLETDTLSKDLTLWHVSIPDDDDNSLPVLLDSVPENKTLKATSKLFRDFETELAECTQPVLSRFSLRLKA
ncbi:hypothetical protein BGZ47_006536 [Haplosporangium gracile]|nr:hypothetical protein BGZ47_006536 [Haplosporangium gracile]